EIPSRVHAWAAVRRHEWGGGTGRVRAVALDAGGRRLPRVGPIVSDAFDARHRWSSQLGARILAGDEWEGRLLLLDSAVRPLTAQSSAMLVSLCQRATPAMYRVYVIRRLRARMRALERMRFAHELHQNVVQGLVALQLQLETLRRRTVDAEPWIPE